MSETKIHTPLEAQLELIAQNPHLLLEIQMDSFAQASQEQKAEIAQAIQILDQAADKGLKGSRSEAAGGSYNMMTTLEYQEGAAGVQTSKIEAVAVRVVKQAFKKTFGQFYTDYLPSSE